MAERVSASDYDSIRLINRVLTLYYVQELTQAEVGQRLGLSTTKVNRLLQQAREQGMVEITIRTPFQYLFDLEARLKASFDISDAVVIPQIAEQTNAMVHTLGRAGANYLLGRLQDGDVVAIGGGTAVHAVVQALETRRSYDVKVVPCMGAVQGRVTTDVNYLATQLAARLGGPARGEAARDAPVHGADQGDPGHRSPGHHRAPGRGHCGLSDVSTRAIHGPVGGGHEVDSRILWGRGGDRSSHL